VIEGNCKTRDALRRFPAAEGGRAPLLFLFAAALRHTIPEEIKKG